MDLFSGLDKHAQVGLLIVGVLYTSNFLFGLIHGIYARLLRGGKNLKKYGSYAVVTGATDGIGKAMAFEFARKGLNVLLISRTLTKLEESKAEIKAKYENADVQILDIDFSNFDEAARERVKNAIASLDVGVLVNNVGVSYPFTKYFNELLDPEVESLIRLNVDSTTWMTRIVLPKMITKKAGAIVNIGSAAGVSNSPLLAQYGAAKSYVAMFSRALNAELKSKGVHVQCQVPMFVTTKLAKLRKTSLFVASTQQYARAAVATIGYEALVSPYWSHALQIWILVNFPEWLMSWVTMNMHLGIRAAGLKKEAREREEKEKKN